MASVLFLCILRSVLATNPEATTATATGTTNKLRHRNGFRRRVKENNGEDGDCSAALPRNGMSPGDVKRSAMAARMSALVYDLGEDSAAGNEEAFSEMLGADNDNDNYNYGMYYESGIDAVYTARIGNEYCTVAFRGTGDEQSFRKDAMSNFSFDPVEFDSDDTTANCDIHSGFHGAYFGFEHRSLGIEGFLESCQRDCPTCDVVLTGHSQGGAIAEVAALYHLRDKNASNSNSNSNSNNNNNSNNNSANIHNDANKTDFAGEEAIPENKVYVITFGAPQGLGAGCLPLFSKEERCRFSRYVMTIEGVVRGLSYDLIPMVFPRTLGDPNNDGEIDANASTDSYARHGGLAFVGFEIFLNAENPSSVFLGGFDDHYGVAATSFDYTFETHWIDQYVGVLATQRELYASTDYEHKECYLPTDGFPLGTPCNPDESDNHCVQGISECRVHQSWWWWPSEHTCQMIDVNRPVAEEDERFCHERPLE